LMAPALFSGQELASRLDFRREPRAAGAWQAEGPGCRNSPSPPAAAAVPAEPVAAASKGELGP
jgi:hypothetical protein